jgi:hypothetical protein
MHPVVAILYRVTRRDPKAAWKLAYLALTLPSLGLHDANDFCALAISRGNPIALCQILDEFARTVPHLDDAVACEAAAAVVAIVPVVILKVVQFVGKLLGALNFLEFFGVFGSFLAGYFLEEGRLGRLHLVVNIVRLVGDVVEELTAKIFEALLSEIAFALHLQRSNQVA